MLFTALIKYIRGIISFTILGFFGESFLSKCNEEKIHIWNISPTKEGFCAYTYPTEYKKMRPIVKKTGVRIRVKDRKGLPFIVWKYRKRRGLAIGFLTFWIMLFIFSGRVWQIEVKGNIKVETQTIIEALYDIGIKAGVSTKGMDALMLEKEMLLKVRDLSFIAINFRGSTVYIEVTEVTQPPMIIDDDTKPQNIISGYDGQIIRVEAYEGQPMVKRGDTVLKGDILISGITEDAHQNALIKKARGKVYARTTEHLSAEISLTQDDYIMAAPVQIIPYIQLFSLEIPLKPTKEITEFFTMDKKITNLQFFGNTLHLGVGEKNYTYWTPDKITLTIEQAKELCLKNILQQEMQYFKDCEILNKTLSGTILEDKFIINGVYELNRNIAVSKEILTDG